MDLLGLLNKPLRQEACDGPRDLSSLADGEANSSSLYVLFHVFSFFALEMVSLANDGLVFSNCVAVMVLFSGGFCLGLAFDF